MRIGFIQATTDIDVHWWPSLAFGYLKAYVEKHLGNSVIINRIGKYETAGYDIVGISSTTQDYPIAIEIARIAKTVNPNVITIIGGSHITYMPETLTYDFNFGVIGEGEQTLLEFVKHVMKRGSVEELMKINGLITHWDGGLISTPSREFINPIDDIPFPFREPAYAPHLMTSRGCPYKCTFCSSSAFWKDVRFHSAEYVVNEIERLVCIGANNIPIQDDLFIADRKRFEQITHLLIQKGLNKRFKSSINIRANLVDNWLLGVLNKFPIQEVHFGAESGSNRILTLMGKGVTVEKNQAAIDAIRSQGIKVVCSFIVGWPTETEEELRSTYNFLINNIRAGKLDQGCSMNILSPMPGTKVWSDAVRDGKIDLKNLDFKRLGIFASYRTSNAKSFDNWADIRRQNNSIYLNENTVPQGRLYQIMGEYEDIILGKR